MLFPLKTAPTLSTAVHAGISDEFHKNGRSYRKNSNDSYIWDSNY